MKRSTAIRRRRAAGSVRKTMRRLKRSTSRPSGDGTQPPMPYWRSHRPYPIRKLGAPNATPWGPRVWRVLRAMGWPEKEWREHLILPSRTLKRMMWGVLKIGWRVFPSPRATAEFVIRLRKLETAYADRIEEVEAFVTECQRLYKRFPKRWRVGETFEVKRFEVIKVWNHRQVGKVEAMVRDFNAKWAGLSGPIPIREESLHIKGQWTSSIASLPSEPRRSENSR